MTIPPGYPVFGSDAFRTATGVHAAAVIKAFKKGETELANSVYSGVPSHVFGLEQIIEIGPMSGKSNVIFWLEKRGIQPTHFGPLPEQCAALNRQHMAVHELMVEALLHRDRETAVRALKNVGTAFELPHEKWTREDKARNNPSSHD